MEHPEVSRRLDIREYLNILRARKWMIALITLIVVGIGLFFSYRQTPLYSASARVLVQSLPGPRFVDPLNMETESQLAASIPVASMVVEDLDLDVTPEQLLLGLAVQAIEDTEVLTISYTTHEPVLAQEVANSFAGNYLRYRSDRVLEEFEEAAAAVERRLQNVGSILTRTQRDIERAAETGDEAEVASLQAQRTALEAQLSELQRRLEEVTPDESIRAGAGEIIQAAAVPSVPSSPNHTKDAALATVMGLALGVGVALLRERLDERFASRSDLERALHAPVLATVPRYALGPKHGSIVLTADPGGAASEAYRTLRTSITHLHHQIEAKSLLITSPLSGEGKTATSVNLALALAQTGQKVALVSADLRRPTIESYFGIGPSAGLTSWLTGEENDVSAILRWPARGDGFIPGPPVETEKAATLAIVPSGPTAFNPSELLSSPKLPELLRELEVEFDTVLYDSPPTLPVTDAPLIGRQIGRALIVVHSGGTTRAAATHAKQELERVGVQILGVVLNYFDPGGAEGYGGAYSTYYPIPALGSDSSTNGSDQRETRGLRGRLGVRR